VFARTWRTTASRSILLNVVFFRRSLSATGEYRPYKLAVEFAVSVKLAVASVDSRENACDLKDVASTV
jgi:hypothetical protein